MAAVTLKLSVYLRGWYGYFGKADPCYLFGNLDGWIRRRLRCYQLKLWKHGRGIYRGLRALGVSQERAAGAAVGADHWWKLSGHQANGVLPNKYFDQLGLFRMAKRS